MFSDRSSIASALQNYRLDGRMLCYSNFVPKLYNWCLSLGFTPGKIMPSRAFCSDGSQGYPIILIIKHFGAFPFNHGQVGGIVSTDRHAPHADHGKDLVLLQASHVGYDPDSGAFGVYRRLHTDDESFTCDCGKIGNVIQRYKDEYAFACENIRLLRYEGQPALLIDNCLLSRSHSEGLFLIMDKMVHDAVNRVLPRPLATRSTGTIYRASSALIERIGDAVWPLEGSVAMGQFLSPESFYFRRVFEEADLSRNRLERNLIEPMPWIVAAKHPLLVAACANTMAEFDRAYRSLAQEPAMHTKNLLFISGLNIDISPSVGEEFPLTKFVPWAAYLQRADGTTQIMEQEELFDVLCAQSRDNATQLNLEQSIEAMSRQREVDVRL